MRSEPTNPIENAAVQHFDTVERTAFAIVFDAGMAAGRHRPRSPGKAGSRWLPMAAPDRAANAELMVDLSSWNLSFDANAYASAGHLLVAIKATQGTRYVNPDWARWAVDAHLAHLAVAHYHFADDVTDPIGEARYFANAIRPHYKRSRDLVVLDLEQGTRSEWARYVSLFFSELARLLRDPVCVLYCPQSQLGPDLKVPGGRCWVAAWGSVRPGPMHDGQWLWGWQYTNGQIDTAGGPRTVAGVPSTCDVTVLAPTVVRWLRGALGR